jgi:hypothetical protein
LTLPAGLFQFSVPKLLTGLYRPVMVDLPDEVPDLDDETEKKTWEAAVHRAIERLKEKSLEVRQFLAP